MVETKSLLPMKKNMKKFCQFRILPYLCTAIRKRSAKRGACGKRIGRLAQLVQSVCLTSRGSGVRIPQRPPEKGWLLSSTE